MTSIEKDTIKNRIKKLLALSKSPNENEALSALEKARKLMDEYQLSESDCLYEQHSAKATKRLSRWRAVLASAVAWLNYCESFRSSGVGEMKFFGESIDAFVAAEMFAYLSKTIERIAKQNIRKSAKTKFREEYKLGIVRRLSERIHEMGAAGSWAPQREAKLLAVRKAAEDKISIVREKFRITGTSSAAFLRGMVAGSGISLNRQTTGHGGRYLEDKNGCS